VVISIDAAQLDKRWYVVHTYSGYENKVKTNLEKRVASMDMQDKIFRVLVPTEDEIVTKDGKRKTVTRKVYPGYVLVEMIQTDDSWYVVRNTPGVTGFVGSTGVGQKPVPLLPEEVETILQQMGMAEVPRHTHAFVRKANVRIVQGPFAQFVGTIEDVLEEEGKLRVHINMFGRETPVELDFTEVVLL
jgi:transcriptional antiterminator NusG